MSEKEVGFIFDTSFYSLGKDPPLLNHTFTFAVSPQYGHLPNTVSKALLVLGSDRNHSARHSRWKPRPQPGHLSASPAPSAE